MKDHLAICIGDKFYAHVIHLPRNTARPKCGVCVYRERISVWLDSVSVQRWYANKPQLGISGWALMFSATIVLRQKDQTKNPPIMISINY